MAKGDDIAERLLKYSGSVLKFSFSLPRNEIGKHIALQLVRCATAGGANYEEARGAESRADFIHKAGLARKEIRESIYWLNLVVEGGATEKEKASELIAEANELAAILTSSAKTARANSNTRNESIRHPRSVVRHSSSITE